MFTVKKDPFRAFPRDQVAAIMGQLGVDPSNFDGPKRAKNYFLYFDTFDTLSDGLEYLAEAMTIELEHGRIAAKVGSNVTDDDPLKTAQIAVAHVSGVEYGEDSYVPFLQYYDMTIWNEAMHSAWCKKQEMSGCLPK